LPKNNPNNWKKVRLGAKYPVPEDGKLEFALKLAGLSENLSFLCLEELLKNRYITKKTIITTLRIKVMTMATPNGLNLLVISVLNLKNK